MFSTPMLANIIRFYGHAMQGVMGTWLEKNLQALAEMQERLGQGGNPSMPGFNPFAQGLMGSYFEQSKKMFEQMQEQMSKGEGLFPLPTIPGFTPPKR
jgi:polyhydroxyalkanoate synthesis regulator protein